jgi:hypothetical protein
MVFFQSIIFLGLILSNGFSLDTLLFPAIIGITLKLFSLLGLILFFSTFTSPMIAMFLTIASYIIGHGGYAMLEYAYWDGAPIMGYIGKMVLIFFPNLESLNLKLYVATDADIILSTWFTAYGINIVYIGILLLIGSLIFSKKSFDNA